jgi:hypothetical protein
MLTEHKTRQVEGEPPRRWFCDDLLDLLVWLDTQGTPLGFQLCFQTGTQELALVWKKDEGFANFKVDSGEESPKKNLSPLLVEEGVFPANEVLQSFRERSLEIDAGIRDFILERLGNKET